MWAYISLARTLWPAPGDEQHNQCLAERRTVRQRVTPDEQPVQQILLADLRAAPDEDAATVPWG